MKKIIDFLKNEDGIETPEYALLGTLIAIAIIAGATLLGTKVNETYTYIAGQIPGTGAGS